MLRKGEYRAIVGDCLKRNMTIYWLDFLITFGVLLVSAFYTVFADFGLLKVLSFSIAVLTAYRCASFIHEVVHLSTRDASQKRFAWFWNMTFGVPFLSPSYLYNSHLEHHLLNKYGTVEDPEYAPLQKTGALNCTWFVLEHAFSIPGKVVIHLLLNPFKRLMPAWLAERLHKSLYPFAINNDYQPSNRSKPKSAMDIWTMRLCTVMVYVYVVLFAGGILPIKILLTFACIVIVAMALNGVRTLVAHRYFNAELETLSAQQQLADSVNLTGIPPFLGELLAPVGLRFHALHHLFPDMPYHNLARAHDLLMAAVPEDDTYRETNDGFFPALKKLV